MKKLLVIIGLIISSLQVFSQSSGNDTTLYTYYRYAYGNALDRYWAKKVLMAPADTVYSKDGLAILHGVLYVGNGIRWNLVTGTGGTGGGFSIRQITSSNFSTSKNCPLPSLNGDSLSIYWDDLNRYLVGGTEWTYLSGGGFIINVPGFNASSSSYTMTVTANSGSISPGPIIKVSADFSTATNCPIPSLNGMILKIFWNDANRYLLSSEWSALAGGGFTVTIPGFNATTNNYTFYIFNQ